MLYNSEVGDTVMLYRDAENEFDKWAVMVRIDGTHVGWMSKSDAYRFGRAMDIQGVKSVIAKLISTTEKYPRIQFNLQSAPLAKVDDQIARSEFS